MTNVTIPWAKPAYWGGEIAQVTAALESTWISGGPFVDQFEQKFSALSGSTHALTASNGTTALYLAYLGLDLKPGDEVIVPGFGFMAAANVALHLSLRPVFCDVDPDTWCMRAEQIEAVTTKRTRALVVVHTYGGVCDMAPILDLARERGIAVIEDAAEALGSTYRGRLAGTLGEIGTFSFHATKIITTGEGGMVVSDQAAYRDRMALFRSHGMLRKKHYWHEVPGLNFRLTNLQAALGCAQIDHLDRIKAAKKRVTHQYHEALAGLPGVTLQSFGKDVDPVVWAVALRLDPAYFPQGRDAVMAQLAASGIETRPGFYTATDLAFYGEQNALPISQNIAQSAISLPSYPTLETREIEFVCEALKRVRSAAA